MLFTRSEFSLIEQDILQLLSTKDVTVDEVLRKLDYYSNYSLIKCINKLLQEHKVRFRNSKLTVKQYEN